MTKIKFLIIVFFGILLIVIAFKYSEESKISPVNTSTSSDALKPEFQGKEISQAAMLEQIIKASKYASEIKIIRAYRYGDFVYAMMSSGEGGWHEIYYTDGNSYTQLAGGQDNPMCSSFEGYNVPKGLWCRMGGCFQEPHKAPVQVENCYSPVSVTQ